EVIYDLRLFALEGGEDLKGEIREMTDTAIRENIADFTPEDLRPEQWDLGGLRQRLALEHFMVVTELPEETVPDHRFDTAEEIEDLVLGKAHAALTSKFKEFGEHEERILSWILLSVIDEKWRDHLYDLDHLKASIGFRGWGQKDPLVEYKQEAYEMFVDFMKDIRKHVSGLVFRAQLAPRPAPRMMAPKRLTLSGPGDVPGDRQGTGIGVGDDQGIARQGLSAGYGAAAAGAGAGRSRVDRYTGGGDVLRGTSTNRGDGGGGKQAPVTVEDKVGRNDPCPCGSGRKYKKCHGAGVA
ncbi:MAG TPA: SEC-C metal-binding domain-containing protein, partial [Gemmatimonadota bacterium]|nr:SEC-C metal-binding domain-containing protein [Gemmatimonadota bacterium]